MKLSEIETPISTLSGIGPSKAKLFANLGIYTISDLLTFYPKDWEDRTKRINLAEYKFHSKVHTIAQVIAHSWFGYGKMKTLKISIYDGTAHAELVAFNRPFLEKSLPVNSIISVTGNFSVRYNQLQSSSFEADLIEKNGSLENFINKTVPGSKFFPLYHLTAGLTNAQIRKAMEKALQTYGNTIENELPLEIIQKRKLLTKKESLFAIHAPKNIQEALNAKKTLIYEELFHFQKAIALRTIEHKGRLPDSDLLNNQETIFSEEKQKNFEKSLSPSQIKLLKNLPFQLTEGQKIAITEINQDINQSEDSILNPTKINKIYTMSRLVQGDVGSGKTLIAIFACLRIVDYKGQCAFLAPTELLARQHAENIATLLEPLGIRLAYLTGNIKSSGRGALLEALRKGEIDIIIGTHALFSRNVQYKNLRLAIIDEQHRFGVLQRNAILEKGRKLIPNTNIYKIPSLLMLSATPIPRTLALTVFGDLDVSIIKTIPKGRLPIKTYLTRMGNEQNVYDFVKNEIYQKHQAYFVYPRIEDYGSKSNEDDFQQNQSEINMSSGLKSAEEMYKYLKTQIYPNFNIALIHSKTDENEQYKILNDFRQGKIDILVATSVVEVGVDVPNATCMVIEHADRFGLAALHQLRGRVGRGSKQSHCFLIYSKNISETGISRMKVLRETTDGFIIAEEDLKLRGPGEVTGIQQSGYLTLGIADPIRDKDLLEIARQDVFELLKSD